MLYFSSLLWESWMGKRTTLSGNGKAHGNITKYLVSWEGFSHKMLVVMGKIFLSQKIAAGASVHGDDSTWEGSFEGTDSACLVWMCVPVSSSRMDHICMHFPVLLTAPPFTPDHPIYDLRLCHRCAGKTIIKDSTITCFSCENSSSLPLAPSLQWQVLPMRSKASSKWPWAHGALYIGKHKGDFTGPWDTQAPFKGQSHSASQHIWKPGSVNLCTSHAEWEVLPQASQLAFSPYCFQSVVLLPKAQCIVRNTLGYHY